MPFLRMSLRLSCCEMSEYSIELGLVWNIMVLHKWTYVSLHILQQFLDCVGLRCHSALAQFVGLVIIKITSIIEIIGDFLFILGHALLLHLACAAARTCLIGGTAGFLAVVWWSHGSERQSQTLLGRSLGSGFERKMFSRCWSACQIDLVEERVLVSNANKSE